MFKRSIPAVVLFCGSLLLGSPTFADEADLRTARSLYQQFLQQVEAEQYQQALETYRRIDAVQLSREEQTRLHETALNIDRRIQGDQIDPADLLRQAEADLAVGRFGPASARFGQVLESNTATERQQSAAEAGLATATRRLSAGLEQARQQIADAEAALARGQVDVARNLLNEVRNSGLALGRFDSRHLQNLMSRVDEIDRQTGRPSATVAGNGNGNGVPGGTDGSPAAQFNGWDEPEAELPRLADAGTNDGSGAGDANGESSANGEGERDIETVNLRRAQSQRLVEEGLQALGEGRHFATNEIPNPRQAIERFRAALQVDPTNQAAAEQLQRVQRDFGMVTSARDLSEVQVESVRLEVQRILAEFEDRMEAARRALMADNFGAAARAAIEARQTLDRSPHIPREQYGRLVQRASDLSIQIDNRREQFEAERREVAVSEEERREQRAAIQGEEQRREEINRALTLANRYRLQQRYDEAIEQVQQALFIDPQNLPARFFLDSLEESRNLARVRDLRRTRSQYIQLHSVENLEATIPWTENITFPNDWRELSHRRWRMWGDFETDDDRRTLERMRQVTFTLGDVPRPLNDILDELRRESGLSIIVMTRQIQDEAFVNPADVEVAGPWTRTMERALESILAEVTPDGSVTYEIVDGDIIISTKNFFRQRNSRIETYDVRDLIAPPPNYTGPELNPGVTGNTTGTGGGTNVGFGLFGGGGGGGTGGGLTGTAEGISTEESIAQLRDLIQNTVGDADDWSDFALDGGGAIEERQGLLIVRTTPSNHRAIRGLLSMLRSAQTDQIHLEGRFITVTQGFLEEIGIDLDVNMTSTGAWGDVVSENEDGDSVVTQRLGMTQNSFGMAARSADAIAGLPGGQALSLGAVAGFMDDVEVRFLLRATQASRRAVNLEAPRLTFSNGQQAFISVATSTSFVGNLSPVSGAGGADTDVETADEGFTFQVRGTISADKRFVTLDLNPQISSVDLTQTQRVPVFSAAGTGIGDNGDVQAAQDEIDITLPQITQTSLSTTVTVPDRGSLLMGGQRLVDETEIEVGVPILSKIPVLNRLFSNTSTVKSEKTLLILVKPTILIMDELEEDNFPGILESRRSYGIGRPIN